MIDTNLLTESQEIHSKNDFECNSSGDEEVTSINTYIHRVAIDQQGDKLLQIVSSIKQHTEEKIPATVTKQKTHHHFWKF